MLMQYERCFDVYQLVWGSGGPRELASCRPMKQHALIVDDALLPRLEYACIPSVSDDVLWFEPIVWNYLAVVGDGSFAGKTMHSTEHYVWFRLPVAPKHFFGFEYLTRIKKNDLLSFICIRIDIMGLTSGNCNRRIPHKQCFQIFNDQVAMGDICLIGWDESMNAIGKFRQEMKVAANTCSVYEIEQNEGYHI